LSLSLISVEFKESPRQWQCIVYNDNERAGLAETGIWSRTYLIAFNLHYQPNRHELQALKAQHFKFHGIFNWFCWPFSCWTCCWINIFVSFGTTLLSINQILEMGEGWSNLL